MTTYYVSSTADNGYAVGNDSNSAAQAQSKATPWLTVQGAIANASVVSTDTIIINGGAVAATNLYTATTFFNDSKGLTFQGDNSPRLTSAAAQARVFNQNTTANSTFTGLILDGLGNATSPFTISAAASAPTVTIDGCIFRDTVAGAGAGTYAINNSSSNLNLVVKNSTLTAVRSCIQSVALATGSITATDNTMTTLAASSGTEGTIRASASATGITSYIARNTLTCTSAVSGSGANPYGVIHLSNIVALIERNRISISGAAATVACIALTSEAAVLAENSVIRWNELRHSATTGGASGYLIIVGADATGVANDNQVNYPVIYGNYCTGVAGSSPTLHGILLGFIKAGYVFGNFVDYADLHLIAKDTTERSIFANNVLPHSTSGGDGMMRTKGALTTHFVGNSLATDSVNANKAMYVTVDGATNSTGNVFSANTISAPWTVTTLVQVDASQTATFLFNDYDLAGVSGAPWSYQGVTRATLALWTANNELTAKGVAAPVADRNFWAKMSSGSPVNQAPIGLPTPPWGQ